MHLLKNPLGIFFVGPHKAVSHRPLKWLACHSTNHARDPFSLLSQLHLICLKCRWLTCWEFLLKVSCFFLHYSPISTIKYFFWYILRQHCVFLKYEPQWWLMIMLGSKICSFWALCKWWVAAYSRVFSLVTVICFPSCHIYFCTPLKLLVCMLTVLVCSAGCTYLPLQWIPSWYPDFLSLCLL